MEPILFIGGVIVLMGGIWTVVDLLHDAGFLLKATKKDKEQINTQTYSGFKSRDISSNTACRAGFPQ